MDGGRLLRCLGRVNRLEQELELAVQELSDAAGGADPRVTEVVVNGEPHWFIGWITHEGDTEALLDSLRHCRLGNDLVGVEVGSWVGYTATLMLDAVPELTLTCVDTFLGSASDMTGELREAAGIVSGDPDIVWTLFGRNTERFGERCRVLRMGSLEAADQFEDRSLDFVFIDADHTYEGCRADIEAWLPKLKLGGVICGHDYSEGFPGVVRAVDEIFGDIVETQRLVWFVDLVWHKWE
jgi:predicted O-methyltransferase YrrM